MKTNPTRISWVMPTERVDNSQIDGVLAANIYIDDNQIASYPSALNPGATAEMLFADLAWTPTPAATHVVTVTAQEGNLESAPSTGVEIRFLGKPLAPTSLSVS
jgi:hypothetical protein